jgi:hypothetical protein
MDTARAPRASRSMNPYSRTMPDADLVATLSQQLAKYEAAVEEFRVVEAQLQAQRLTARLADMLRLNRETINAMERSAELLRERLSTVKATRATQTPF